MAEGAEADVDEPSRCHLPVITVSDLPTVTAAGRNLKEWLQEQFCDESLEQDDMRLHNAAYVGDLDTLRNLLQEDGFRERINEKSVWCCGCLPCTPLRIAATAGHVTCVAYLISQGAEVDLVDVKGQTALYVAVVNGHLDCVRVLLEAGANPNGSRHHRSTPLYHAVRVGRLDVLQELIRFNADVDMDHQLGPRLPLCARTLSTLVVCPLYISAAYHNLRCFRALLEAGAQPDFNYSGPVCHDALTRGPASCLLDAVLRHGCEVAFVQLLLDHGANPVYVPWNEAEMEAPNRRKVDPEALRVFLEARKCPGRLTHLCRIRIRRVLGKKRLQHIPSLPLPQPIKNFLLHQN
uniref:ankyrin repeat and SOCS box protein 1 n=1 Tax=Doryrhamphus excisus TaxID=161450 RepID=UPI0025ADD986|nr:ankyrin repeat and SOCS box protein 1 [Doryrhamphus excisus]XP_057938622.1 ankyrin repeat and SOCS box protein 1 [Doryrhamphus excisus]XP_057938623.1 ankyrin repeat and SOCS box protein 1 [Doryrhamphus excisus]XP_057938624.1 ankyrin repeat and SOCS box protein 1 [Doryrhamphus excisus]